MRESRRLRRINLPYRARQSPAQPQNGNFQTLRSCQRVRAITQALDCRTYDRLAEPLPPTGQGLGESQSQRSRFPQTRFHPPHVAKAMQSLMKSPDGLSAMIDRAELPVQRKRTLKGWSDMSAQGLGGFIVLGLCGASYGSACKRVEH